MSAVPQKTPQEDPSQLHAAVVQMVSTADLEENLKACQLQLSQLSDLGCQFVVLPENFAQFDPAGYEALANQTHAILDQLGAWAKQYGLWLAAGSLPVLSPEPNRYYSRCHLFNDKGQVAGSYDKLHLFDVDVVDAQQSYRESERFYRGQKEKVIATPWGGMGLSICYDLRFPSLYQSMAEKVVSNLGMNLIIVPAAFTYTTGRAHWELLLRARAVETQCFVLGANQGGKHDAKRRTSGQSMIVSPWGEVLARCQDQGADVGHATLSLPDLYRQRARMPIAKHNRFQNISKCLTGS